MRGGDPQASIFGEGGNVTYRSNETRDWDKSYDQLTDNHFGSHEQTGNLQHNLKAWIHTGRLHGEESGPDVGERS